MQPGALETTSRGPARPATHRGEVRDFDAERISTLPRSSRGCRSRTSGRPSPNNKRCGEGTRILVRMTRIRRPRTQGRSQRGKWALQDAKARFSEVVRKAKTEGPQKITVHGREEVVVVSVEEYRRVKGQPSGQALVKVLQDSPLGHIRIERTRSRARVRSVDL